MCLCGLLPRCVSSDVCIYWLALNDLLIVNKYLVYTKLVVVTLWILKTMSVFVYPTGKRLSCAPPDPRSRTTAPRSHHTATLGVPGERSGAAVHFGKRGAWKAIPGTGLLGPRYGGGS